MTEGSLSRVNSEMCRGLQMWNYDVVMIPYTVRSSIEVTFRIVGNAYSFVSQLPSSPKYTSLNQSHDFLRLGTCTSMDIILSSRRKQFCYLGFGSRSRLGRVCGLRSARTVVNHIIRTDQSSDKISFILHYHSMQELSARSVQG